MVARRPSVENWAFGLVDRHRRLKPAALAVAAAFEDAPFAREIKTSWPRVSVVVCAYNAADVLEDCLARSSGSPIPTTKSSLSTTGRAIAPAK